MSTSTSEGIDSPVIKKRDGSLEDIRLEKLLNRLRKMTFDLDSRLNIRSLTDTFMTTLNAITDADQLDTLLADACARAATKHPDFAILAGRIEVSRIHKTTPKSFSAAVNLWSTTTSLAPDLCAITKQHAQTLDSAIIHDRDFDLTYFAIHDMKNSFLLHTGNTVMERPQHMFMRMAISIHGSDIERVLQSYTYLSKGFYTHSASALVAAGLRGQYPGSAIMFPADCSTKIAMHDSVQKCIAVGQHATGIGISLHTVMPGWTDPLLRLIDATAPFLGTWSSSPSAVTKVYLEPWHPDVITSLMSSTPHSLRAVWIPDLFMRRVQHHDLWTFFSSGQSEQLSNTHGVAFDELYESFESSGLGVGAVPADDLWDFIMQTQMRTGGPSVVYKDSVNDKSNHRCLGVIQSSDPSCTFMQYNSPSEPAVCNSASLNLPRFFTSNDTFDFPELERATMHLVEDLNATLDRKSYPSSEYQTSTLKHRPIGVSVEGLADVFMAAKIPYDSDRARILNIRIFEVIYHAALQASCNLARDQGPYTTWIDSPAHHGRLQFDLWNSPPNGRYNWPLLKSQIKEHGLRNSLLIASVPNPPASLFGDHNPSIAPYDSVILNRHTNSGLIQIVNSRLVRSLMSRDLWTEEMYTRIIDGGGSVQAIETIPVDVRDVFRTVWELDILQYIRLSADRGRYICHSESLDLYINPPTTDQLAMLHSECWKLGLKTGMHKLILLDGILDHTLNPGNTQGFL